MKKSILFFSLLLLGAFVIVQAESSPSYKVEVEDLIESGMTNVKVVETTKSRFQEPMQYFRVAEALDEKNAKKDCEDCGNLVAVYIGTTPTIPGWIEGNSNPLRRIGGRIQARRYLPNKKLVIIVTTPLQENAIRLSNRLVEKFGAN